MIVINTEVRLDDSHKYQRYRLDDSHKYSRGIDLMIVINTAEVST